MTFGIGHVSPGEAGSVARAQHIKGHFWWWCVPAVMRCRVHSVGDFDPPTAAPSSS